MTVLIHCSMKILPEDKRVMVMLISLKDKATQMALSNSIIPSSLTINPSVAMTTLTECSHYQY